MKHQQNTRKIRILNFRLFSVQKNPNEMILQRKCERTAGHFQRSVSKRVMMIWSFPPIHFWPRALVRLIGIAYLLVNQNENRYVEDKTDKEKC